MFQTFFIAALLAMQYEKGLVSLSLIYLLTQKHEHIVSWADG